MVLGRNKIGFHSGPSGGGANKKGIGEYFKQLDAARIPFVIKSTDHYGEIFEANELRKVSNVPHVLVYRLTTIGQNTGYDFDVPRYDLSPLDAAILHWNKTKERLPAEFDKYCWLEVINEVNKDKSGWLGEFATEIAQLANAEGYKIALFAWSPGEPEPTHWEEPGMLRFLSYCAENKDVCGVSLHEYSLLVDNILDQYPFKVGRFQYLFATCDKHGIDRPTTLITEWGWTLNNVPGPEQALIDIQKANELYAPYSNILGAAIWYLGPGFEGIANKAQKLIQPVTDYALNTFIEFDKLDPKIEGLPKIGEWKQHGEENMALEWIIATRHMVEGVSPTHARIAFFKYTDLPDGIEGVPDGTKFDKYLSKTEDFELPEGTDVVALALLKETNPNQPPVEQYPLVVDVSHWQGSINMGTMKSRDVRKLMMKVTEHTTHVDTRFATYYLDALAAGYQKKDIALYHYYRFNKSPVDQANHFVDTALGIIDNPACAFVVDVEDIDNSAVGKQGDLKLFLDIVEYRTGFKPIIYTASWWWTTARWGGDVPWAKNYALVEAEYKFDPPVQTPPKYVDFELAYEQTKVSNPTIPPDWTKHNFWQFTSKARGSDFGASSTYIDVQTFNGTLDELNAIYMKPGTITENPVSDTSELIDMLSYLRGPDKFQYEMRRPDGSQERYQIQWFTNGWYIVKGENQGHFEKWTYDDNYIYLEMDTSPENAPDGQKVYYTIRKNGQRSIKYKRFMRVEEVVTDSGHVVTFFNKSNCLQNESDTRSGNATNTTTFVQGPHSREFYNNIVLPDVIHCLENVENQYWAKNFGRCKWQSPWLESQVSEIHGIGTRPDVPRETGCFSTL